MKRYKEWNPFQASLLPVSPAEWLKEDHLVYFLLDVLSDLDLREIEAVIHSKDARGNRPYSPRMMVGLLLYGYCVGKVSSRKLERATYEEVPFRVLCGEQHPDHSAISEFRKVHLEALGGLFHQILRLCKEAGLVKLGHVALDGTKIKANASKHKANSYKGLERSEQKLLDEVKDMLERAEKADEAEDAKFGKDRTGDELPDELRIRSDRLRKIQEAKKALEADAALTKALEKNEQAEHAEQKAEEDRSESKVRRAEKAALEAEEACSTVIELAEERVADAEQRAEQLASEADDQASKRTATVARQQAERVTEERDRAVAIVDEMNAELVETDANDDRGSDTDSPDAADEQSGSDSSKMPERRTKADKHGDPIANAQRNFTDPDSQVMKDGTGFAQAYNCQAAVDEANQVIVAAGLSNQANDSPYLLPMLDAVIGNCGRAPSIFTADAGYSSEANLEYCETVGVDAYIPSGRKARSPDDVTAEDDEQRHRTRVEEMNEKIATEEGRERYGKRKWVGEAPFGNIKEGRGFRQFLLRGIEKTKHEWSLICAGHNLLKLFGAAQR